MAPGKQVVCSLVFAALAAIIFYELQQVTDGFTINIFIEKTSPEVVSQLIADPRAIQKLHPLMVGVSDLEPIKDSAGYDVIKYAAHEKMSILSIYNYSVSFSVTRTVLQPNALIRNDVDVNWMFQMTQHWELSEKPAMAGTILVDRVKMSGYRCVVQFSLATAMDAHHFILQQIKRNLEAQ